MPYRNRATLQSWLAEFAEQRTPLLSEIRVIEQDGTDGSNTGLVRVQLLNATTGAYIQPSSIGATEWVVTMEAREDPITLSATAVDDLADELRAVSALCAFLQAKSTAHLAADQD